MKLYRNPINCVLFDYKYNRLDSHAGNYGLVVAQQLDGDVGNTNDPLNYNLSPVQTEPLSDVNQTQSFFNSDNQSVMLPESIKDNLD